MTARMNDRTDDRPDHCQEERPDERPDGCCSSVAVGRSQVHELTGRDAPTVIT